MITTREQLIDYCMTFPGVFEDYPFRDHNWTCMRIRRTNRIFAWIFEKDEQIWVNVKCNTEWRDVLRSAYLSVIPAFHLNKEHWNSIICNCNVPDNEIERMIGESYDLNN